MSINIDRSGPQLNENKIAKAESRLGLSIPPAYRRFLMTHNGGHPDPSDFKMTTPRGREVVSVRTFLGIDMPEETFGLDYVIETFKDRLPRGLFPVARDPGGNIIALATEGENAGKVYFWDHEGEADEGEPPSEDNLNLVSDSFDSFLKNLGNV
jgi:SMI1 / KNR4 family (SUKH-1)